MSSSRDKQFKGILPLKGLKLRPSIGTDFEVLKIRPYILEKEKNRHVSSVQEGMLLSIPFHGQKTPIIVVRGGFVILIEIRVDDEKVEGTVKIIEKLGISVTDEPRALYIV